MIIIIPSGIIAIFTHVYTFSPNFLKSCHFTHHSRPEQIFTKHLFCEYLLVDNVDNLVHNCFLAFLKLWIILCGEFRRCGSTFRPKPGDQAFFP